MTAAWVVLGAVTVAAQQDRGSVAGSVGEASKAVLQGAQVVLNPGGQKAVTDAQGGYILAGVKPGHYTVQITYLGFEPYSAEIDVAAGAVTRADAVLSVGSAATTVEVRAEREVGETEALNRERAAVNLVQVLPSEVINSLPNVNIADAVGRMPSVSLERDEGEGKYIQIRGTEPRLNNVTIDGIVVPSPENVRNVKLDTIPADLVESIEVNKTLTANMDADGIGGSVNLVTRQATDQPYFAIEGLDGHTPIGGGRGEDEVFATYGRRFLADKKLGFLVTGSYDWNGRGINDIEPSQNVNAVADGSTVNAPNEIDVRDYWYDRSRYGLGGALDYKFNDRANVYLKGLYSYFDDFGENGIYSLQGGNFLTATTTDATGNTSYKDNYRRPVQEIFSWNAGGRQDFGQSTLTYRAALSQAKLTGGSTYSTFTGPGPTTTTNADGSTTTNNDGVAFQITTQNPHLPQFKVTQTPGGIFDPTQYALSQITFADNHTFERDLVGEVDYSRGYTRGSIFGTWEAGVKVRDVIKNQLYDQSAATGGGALLSTLLSGHTDPSYYFKAYQFGPEAQATRVLSYYQANPGLFTLDTEALSNLQNDFHNRERVYAGFGMNTLNYGRYRINTGLRVEATSEDVRGNELNAATNVLSPLHNTNTYTYVLPSVNGQYSFSDYTDVRAAFSIGLARPNYGDLAPYLTYDPNTSSTPLSGGNPKLKATWAENVDLQAEHYFKTVGVIQGGAFYKMLYNPIYNSVAYVQYTPAGDTQPQTLREAQPINGNAAHLIGFEASWEQHLRQLPGALSGTGFRANYSYTTSVAGVPGRSDHPTLQRDAPNNYNFDVTYDKYNLSARMGLTHNDAYLWQYSYQDGTPIAGAATTPTPGGVKGPLSDTYIYPHTQVDAQVSYLVPKGRGMSVVAQFLNLNNEVFGFYNGSQQYPIQREYYSPTYTFGLRWTQSGESGKVFHQ
ncbi:MAG TPA: TonB-dependent receptor [Acidobacteriaceae bacterium]